MRGSGLCYSSDECKGQRVCLGSGVCNGTDACAVPVNPTIVVVQNKTNNCTINEKMNFAGPGKCFSSDQCQGNRTCISGNCSGSSNCTLNCFIDETKNKLGSMKCSVDIDCNGNRYCSIYGYCHGKSDCTDQNYYQ